MSESHNNEDLNTESRANSNTNKKSENSTNVPRDKHSVSKR